VNRKKGTKYMVNNIKLNKWILGNTDKGPICKEGKKQHLSGLTSHLEYNLSGEGENDLTQCKHNHLHNNPGYHDPNF
jgi:hypothetical protein